MPAVYSIDLIAKRDKKIRMDRSIVKGWNVHYQTLEEVEAAARDGVRKEEEAARSREQPRTQNEDGEAEKKRMQEAYNPKTGAYSGHYGKKPVNDEGQKQQIHAILNEKPEPFEYAMSTIQAQNQSGEL